MTRRVPMDNYENVARRFRWNLPDTFNFGADVVDVYASDPTRLALIWCDDAGAERRFTFRDIRIASNRIGNALRRLGVVKGDRVLIVLPRIPEWQLAMVACLKLGAIPVPCVEILTAHDLGYRIRHSEAKAVITAARNVCKFADAPADLVRISVGQAPGWLDLQALAAAESEELEPALVQATDPAIIYYTSGSSGHPKGVTHAARALYAWRVSAWYWLDLTENDLMWCTADTGWSKAGTSILFGPWSCGSATLFYNGRFDPVHRLQVLEKYRVTVFCAAATELRRILNENIQGYDLTSLRLTVSAGESVDPQTVQEWRRTTGRPLLDGYGQTETLMTVLNYKAMPVKPGSMGKPLPGTEIAVLLDDEDAVAPPNTVGRLVVKLPNPQVMLYYWKDPERTAQTRVKVGEDEYFITGDRALIDDDGYVFYQGRADDIINSAGYRIGPFEVENALIEHPAVQECAAVASPHPERGEVVKAFVVPRPGYEASSELAKQLQDHCKSITAPYKYPRRIEFVDELPKTPTGKVKRNVLKAQEFAHYKQV